MYISGVLYIEKYNFSNLFKLSNLVVIVWNFGNEIKGSLLYYLSCKAYVCRILYKANYRKIIKENNQLISFLAAN